MKFFNTLAKKIVATVAVVVAVVGITGVAIAGFGPDRPTKQWFDGVSGFDHVTYNSFIGIDGKGDERDFLEGVQVDKDASWKDPINNVEAGEVEVKLYMHNNADTSLNASGVGVAKDVTARVEIPGGKTQVKDLKGFIGASNAVPASIYDTLTLTGANGGTFEVEPVIGSGKLMENRVQIGTVDVNQLVTTGVKLADQNGCSKYVREITFRVKVKVASWTLDKQVSPAGKGQWSKNYSAKPGEKVDYMLTTKNIGNVDLYHIVLGDRLPSGLTYDTGSAQILSADTSWKWTTLANDSLFTGGSDTGNYGARGPVKPDGSYDYSTAYIRFTATVAPIAQLNCGHSVLTNLGFAKPQDYGTIQSDAVVTVDKTCEVVVVKECKALTVAKINRTTFDFTAEANVSNATVTSYVFTAKDKNGNVIDTKTVTTGATTAAYRFVKDATGDYKVSVVINTDKGVATGICEKTVTVTEVPKTPVYSCDAITVDKIGDRKIKVTVSATADPSNRVQVKGYEYNYGDGSAVLNTDKNPTEYTYAKDGTYNVSVKVTFTVDGVNQTVTGAKCASVVTFAPTVTTLPKTGAGNMLGMFIATTFVSMIGFRAYASRKQ